MVSLKRLLAAGALVCAVALAAGVVFAAAGSGATADRQGTDPLSATETADARARATAGQGDAVLLRTERHEEDKGDGRRRADVDSYDYATDTLTHTVVDLATGRVDVVERAQGVQPPLVESETRRAVDLVLANPAAHGVLRRAYRRATGMTLADARGALEFHALVFRADSMPDRATGALSACGIHRCAQMLVQTRDHVLVDVLPIVDLSTGRVVGDGRFFGRPR